MLALQHRIRKLENYLPPQNKQNIKFEGNSFIINNNHNYFYLPSSSALKFHQSNKFVRLLMGPYGSGKSSACMAEVIFRSKQMPMDDKGIRRSRWAIVRNTYGELETTTLVTWLRWFEELGEIHKIKKPVLTYTHHFRDEKGPIELELIFLALDREADLGKIRSLEVTGCYLNELSEIPEGALTHFKGRVGRYPSVGILKEPYWSGIIADTNPPSTRSWIYQDFEKKNPEDYEIIRQPPGLLINENNKYITNPNADNIKNLPKNYYLNMANSSTEEFIKVFCLGEYGIVKSGKKVYPEYNDDTHACDDLPLLSNSPIYMGLDFGCNPAAVLLQQNSNGQLRVFKEFSGYDLGILQFIEDVLNPYITKYLQGYIIEAIRGDPTGTSGVQTDNSKHCYDILKSYHYNALPASTNALTPRLEAVRYYLNRLSDGKPLFLLSKKCCPLLREGFLGEYHYKKINLIGEEKYRDEPYKTHPYSDVHDALQYILMYFVDVNKKSNYQIDVSQFMNRGLRF